MTVFRRPLLALALLAAPAAAQLVVPQMSADKAGSSRALYARDVAAGANAVLGHFDGAGSFLPVVPPLSDVTGNADYDISAMIPFGNTGAKAADFSRRTAPSTVTRGTRAIVRKTIGSGTFGPSAADYGLLVGASKDGWATSSGSAAIEGEVDGGIVTVRQGKKGDAAGLLIDVLKRRDALTSIAADESGGAGGLEVAVGLINSTGATYHNLHALLGSEESVGGLSGGLGHGLLLRADLGTYYSGLTLQGNGGTGGFYNYLVGSSDGTQAGVNFAISASGTIRQGLSAAHMDIGYNPLLDIWSVADETGFRALVVNRTTKNLTVQNGIQIGTGSTQTLLMAMQYTDALPSIASGAGGVLATKPVAGAAVGDMVTVVITSANSGFLGIWLKGAVTASGTVTIYAQNLTGAAVSGSSVAYSVKIERFQ